MQRRYLTVDIRHINYVFVDESDSSDPGSGKPLAHVAAHASDTEDEHAAFSQPADPFFADYSRCSLMLLFHFTNSRATL